MSGNGEITAYDAALILMHYVGKITTFPAGDYYKNALPSNQGAKFALEWGETRDDLITLALNAEGLAEVYGSSFKITFDDEALEFAGMNLSPWTQGMTDVVKIEDNVIRFALAGVEALNDGGTIAELRFRVKGNAGAENLVQLLNAVMNEEVVWTSASAQGTPKTYALEQNYPNPFNPETRIRYQIPEGSHVGIAIYNLLGQRVRVLLNEAQAAGVYDIIWDGTNDSGVKLASGVYVYRMKAGNFTQIRKLILMK